MRVHQLEKDIMANHIIEQLHLLGDHDTEGKTLRELKKQLAVARAKEIDITTDDNRWF